MPETDNNLDTKAQKPIKGFSILWKNPKATYTVVITVLIFTVFFGWWRIVDVIKSPFVREPAAESALQDSVTAGLQDISSLRNKDTDGDGLNDYDELYVYGTSPYLEDTDSDGYLDRIEIETGNNPNCPAGQKCLATIGDTEIMTEPSFPSANPLDVSDEELRQLLLKSGIDPALLSQIDDTTLRQLYAEAITDIQLEQTGIGTGEAGDSVGGGDTLLDLQNLSADEVRQLLLQSGVKIEDLNAISDEDLMSFYQEILDQELSQ